MAVTELQVQQTFDWRVVVLVGVGAVAGLMLWAAQSLTGTSAIFNALRRLAGSWW